jgi:hypothetical protein
VAAIGRGVLRDGDDSGNRRRAVRGLR